MKFSLLDDVIDPLKHLKPSTISDFSCNRVYRKKGKRYYRKYVKNPDLLLNIVYSTFAVPSLEFVMSSMRSLIVNKETE